MPEVSDAEYRRLMQRAQVADLVEPIWDDPDLSKDAKRLLKRKYPNLQIPDYDLEEKFEKRLEEDRKKKEEAENNTRRAKEEDTWKTERKRIQDEYKYSDDDMTDLEKMMVDKNVANYEVAAEYRKAKTPRPSKPTYDQGFWNHGKDEKFKQISQNPEGYAREQFLQAIDRDAARARGRTF